jgi:cytochrome c553
MTDAPPRFSLRDLPLPAKLVVTCFLLAVGLGYFSAMVQLHLQHSSRNGEPLPSAADVVEIFAGWKKATDEDRGPPRSKLQKLITGPREGAAFNGSGTMAPAFFTRDDDGELSEKYNSLIKKDPTAKATLDAERTGEQIALDEWLKLPIDDREAAYQTDRLPIPDALKDKTITPKALTEDKRHVRVKFIMDQRCARCHKKGEAVEKYPLENVEQIAKYWIAPDKVEIVNDMVRSDRQIGIEKLTQSTHAHLLSFAMLFSLTGIIFAFTSYPTGIRCFLAPIVVVAQVADVSCWWLARIDGVGPTFALTIIATGAITGFGLLLQIFGSLLNMWTGVSRVVLALVLLAGLVGIGVLAVKVLKPALDAEKQPAAKKAEDKPATPAKAPAPNVAAKKADPPAPAPMPMAQVSHLEKLIMGPRKGESFNGNGSMAPAFFEKGDKKYKELVAMRPEVEQERDGERLVLQAWLRTPIAERRKAYDADSFPLPLERTGKPLTADFLAADKKAVKVKSIITARCVNCHGPDGDADGFPLDTWTALEAYFGKPPE